MTVVSCHPNHFPRQSRSTATTIGSYIPRQLAAISGNVTVIQGDALNPESIVAVSAGHDAAISSIGGEPATIKSATAALIEGLNQAVVKRLVFVGGAGSLEVVPGLQLLTLLASLKPARPRRKPIATRSIP